MDLRTKGLIDFTKTKFGLENYYLKDYKFYRKVNLFNETVYTLSMDWLPNGVLIDEDEFNPKGTACINVNVGTKKFEQVIFVEGTTFTKYGVKFEEFNKEEIIKWIEQETDLTYGEHFQLEEEEERRLFFKAAIDDIKVFPTGSIEIELDYEGNLILFSIQGDFPSNNVKKEKFALSLEAFEPIINEQVKLIELPLLEEKKILPIYAVEEIFITNNGTTTIPFDLYTNLSNYIHLDETIYWDETINEAFKRKSIDLDENITAEQAFSCKTSPESIPITINEQEKCKIAVKTLLQQEYPKDSGNWVLKGLHREKGYIVASLKAQKQDERVFQRKIQVFIHPESFLAQNYIDNKKMLDTFFQFSKTEEVHITKEEAIEKLKSYIEITPYYVYDRNAKKYVLCGKLDCEYAVNASNGELVLLSLL